MSQYPPYGDPRRVRTGNGILALVLGIVSFFGLGCFTGIPAWIIGKRTLQEIDRGEVNQSDRGPAQVGMILGMVTTGLTAVGVLIFIFAIGILGVAVSRSSPNTYGPSGSVTHIQAR